MTISTLALALLGLLLITLERDRVRDFARTLLLVVTGGVLIAPLRGFLERLVGPLSRFLIAQLNDEDSNQPQAARQTTGEPVGVPGQTQAHDLAPRAADTQRRSRYHLTRLIIAILLTAVFAIVVAFEWTFGMYTFPAILGTPVESDLPQGLTSVSTMALLASAITWGLVVLEALGCTRLMPEFSEKAKPAFKVIAFVALGVTLLIAILMGVWRATEGSRSVESALIPMTVQASGMDQVIEPAHLAHEELDLGDTTGLDQTTRTIVGGSLAGLTMMTGAVAFTGLIWLAKYLAAGVLGALLLPLGFVLFGVLPFFDNLVGHLILGVQTAIDWVAGIGQRLIDLIWPPLQSVRDAVHRRVDAWAYRWSPKRADGPDHNATQPPSPPPVAGCGEPLSAVRATSARVDSPDEDSGARPSEDAMGNQESSGDRNWGV